MPKTKLIGACTTSAVSVDSLDKLRIALKKELGHLPKNVEAVDIALAEALRSRGIKYKSGYEVQK